jgi:hypothetical protein
LLRITPIPFKGQKEMSLNYDSSASNAARGSHHEESVILISARKYFPENDKGSVKKDESEVGIILRMENVEGNEKGDNMGSCVISGVGDDDWKDSDMSRSLCGNGILVMNKPYEIHKNRGSDFVCIRSTTKRIVCYVGGREEDNINTKKRGLLWACPTLHGEALMYLKFLHEFMSDCGPMMRSTIHVLMEGIDESGMASHGSFLAEESGMLDSDIQTNKVGVLVDVCMGGETMDATMRIITTESGKKKLVCDSCFVRSMGVQTNMRAVQGVWLAFGVSTISGGVPSMLCGNYPSHWIGHREIVRSEMRVDFPDSTSLCMADLFLCRTRSCSMSVHVGHEDMPPEPTSHLIASCYPCI